MWATPLPLRSSTIKWTSETSLVMVDKEPNLYWCKAYPNDSKLIRKGPDTLYGLCTSSKPAIRCSLNLAVRPIEIRTDRVILCTSIWKYGGACMFRFYIHSFHRSVKHWLRSVTPTYTCVSHGGEGSSALSEGYSELSRGCACPSVGLCWTQNNYNKRKKLTFLGFSGKNWREFLSFLKAFSGPSVGWGEASPISTDSCIWEDTWIWNGTAIYIWGHACQSHCIQWA